MWIYLDFQRAVKRLDSQAVEQYYTRLQYIWYAMGKNNCSDINLFIMEQAYSKLPYDILFCKQVNRFIILHKSNHGGLVSIGHAPDWFMEKMNIWYKLMELSNTDLGWCIQGTLMPLFCCSRAFMRQYYKNEDLDGEQEEPGDMDCVYENNEMTPTKKITRKAKKTKMSKKKNG